MALFSGFAYLNVPRVLGEYDGGGEKEAGEAGGRGQGTEAEGRGRLKGLIPMWLFYKDVLWRAWITLMSAFGTTTLGFLAFTVALPILTSALFLVCKWLWLRRRKELREFRNIARDSLLVGGSTLLAVALICAVFLTKTILRTIYIDNGSSRAAQAEIDRLSKELERRKHTISATDPVFANVIYLLQAFRLYRVKLGPQAQCTIYVTAATDSDEIASLTAQTQIAVSNCATAGQYGMSGNSLPPSLLKESLDGTTPGWVTVNAPEDDRAADELTNNLVHVFQVKRGYKAIPPGRLASTYPLEHYVWLQFGPSSGFASEVRARESSSGSVSMR